MVNSFWVQKYGKPPPRPTMDSDILNQVRGDASGYHYLDMLLTRGWPVEGVVLPACCTKEPSHAITKSNVRVYRDNLAIDGSSRVPCDRCGRPAQIVDPTYIFADDEPPRRVVRLELLTAAVATLSALSAEDISALTELARRVESGELERGQVRAEINRNARLRHAFSGWSRSDLIALMTMLIALATFIVGLQVGGTSDSKSNTYLTPQQFQQLIKEVSTASPRADEPSAPEPSKTESNNPATQQPTTLPPTTSPKQPPPQAEETPPS